jgi:alpha-amylase
MPALSLSFKVHTPYRLNNHSGDAITASSGYFNDKTASAIINQLADECYLPANKIMLAEIKKQQGKFRLAFSISGTAIEQLQAYRPDVIASFQDLVNTGCVEILAETYYNSLSWLYLKKEFSRQVIMHTELINTVFGIEPVIFRNTELIYNNELAIFVADMGYKGILCEGLEKILHGRTPNQVYAAPGTGDFGLLLRNVSLSDDIAFRFDDLEWNEHPLTAEKYASWIHSHSADSNINVFMDYETFGIHKKAATGIFEFLENLPAAIVNNHQWQFITPSEIIDTCCPKDLYDVPKTISWKDKDIASCVWCENMMQNNMLKKIYSIEGMLHKSGCDSGREWWGRLQSADHFYYMSDTGRTTTDGYHELNPFDSAEAAYKNYLGIITDFEITLIQQGLAKFKGEHHYLKNTSIY